MTPEGTSFPGLVTAAVAIDHHGRDGILCEGNAESVHAVQCEGHTVVDPSTAAVRHVGELTIRHLPPFPATSYGEEGGWKFEGEKRVCCPGSQLDGDECAKIPGGTCDDAIVRLAASLPFLR